jgi:hypothetical protein
VAHTSGSRRGRGWRHSGERAAALERGHDAGMGGGAKSISSRACKMKPLRILGASLQEMRAQNEPQLQSGLEKRPLFAWDPPSRAQPTAHGRAAASPLVRRRRIRRPSTFHRTAAPALRSGAAGSLAAAAAPSSPAGAGVRL